MTISISSPAGPDRLRHITCVVHDLLPVFSQPGVVAIVFDCWRELRLNYGMRLYGYVVMEEHLHFLAAPGRPDGCLERFIEMSGERIAGYLAEQRLERFLKRLPDYGSGRRRLWQEGMEVEPVANEEMAATLDYIHINPVKRGYVDHAEEWRYSSARNYAGKEGLVEVDRWHG